MTTDIPWPLGISDFSITEPLANAEAIIASGFDFIEPGLAKAVAMPEPEFASSAERLREQGIRVQSMNWFLPPEIKITGPDVDKTAYVDFLEKAFQRASSLGANAIVLGSPGSRNVPDGFSHGEALDQIVDFLNSCADIIARNNYSFRIALEHVNYSETNILRMLKETIAMARSINRPEIGVAIDFYHLAMESESLETILEADELAAAVQLADPLDRSFPGKRTEIPGLVEFFGMLREIDYRGGVSVEANVENLADEGRAAAAFLRQAIVKSAS